MKKIIGLISILSALVLSSCEKDKISVYTTVADERISVRFWPYENEPGGTTIDTTRGLREILLSGSGYTSSSIVQGDEVKLSEGVIYTVIWSYYDTGNVLRSLSSTFSLNYINNPNSIDIYLGDDSSDVIKNIQ